MERPPKLEKVMR